MKPRSRKIGPSPEGPAHPSGAFGTSYGPILSLGTAIYPKYHPLRTVLDARKTTKESEMDNQHDWNNTWYDDKWRYWDHEVTWFEAEKDIRHNNPDLDEEELDQMVDEEEARLARKRAPRPLPF